MPEYGPIRPGGEQEWPSVNPESPKMQVAPFVPEGSITDPKIAVRGLTPHKIAYVGIKIYRSNNQAGIADATDTSVAFNAIDFAQDVTRPTGATFTTFTIPFAGIWHMVGNVEYTAVDAGDYAIFLYINGAKAEGVTYRVTTMFPRTLVTAVRRMAKNDTVGLLVRHELAAAGNKTIAGGVENCQLTAIYHGPI